MTLHKVLILDDNASFAETLAGVLAHHSFHTRWTHDAEKARALAEQFRPDAMIIDYGLGFQTGTDAALALLRERLVARFIVLTGWTEITVNDLPTELHGQALVLHKPVEIDVLVQAIEQLVA